MTSFTDILDSHQALQDRSSEARRRLGSVQERLAGSAVLAKAPVVVFCAGSFARGEAGVGSDLDIFLSTEDKNLAASRLCRFEMVAELMHVNEAEGFPPFSNDGQYLRTYLLSDLEQQTGSAEDDEGNYFTVRMLMLLEAQPLLAADGFRRQQEHLVQHYFRDGKGKKDFKPLFLLNDVLRYWRTLCLNYEQTRHDATRRWRKKNVNLKFSRMVTVFSTVLPLICMDAEDVAPGATFWSQSPLSRLAVALDRLGDVDMVERFGEFLDAYEEFLTWKEADDIESRLGSLRSRIDDQAEVVSSFLYDALHHRGIPEPFQRFLVL